MSELALTPLRCASCGSDVAVRLLVCPGCHALVHRAELEKLAREAEGTTDPVAAIAIWRDALALLPDGSRQRDAVAQRIDALTAAQEGKTLEEMRQGPPPNSIWAKILGPLGAVGLVIWKIKFLLVMALTKGKLLLLGLTKITTVASMFVFLAFYWRAWGLPFAAAIVAGIYIHEMGHVAELRRRGLSAGAPMFIPGFGALVRLRQHVSTPSEDARIGLAGPLWGLGAALVAFGIAIGTGSKFWSAVAHTTAFINLFNLIPVWQLDGGRGFHALTREQRWFIVAICGAVFAASHEAMVAIIGFLAVFRAFERNAERAADWRAFATFGVLLVTLAGIVMLAR